MNSYEFNYLLRLKPKHLVKLLKKVYEEETKEQVRRIWLAQYPNMDKKTYISFEDFYNKQVKHIDKPKTKEEIMKNVDDILKKALKRR